MKPMRSIIIDDEPLAHNVILKYAEDISDLMIVDQFYLAMDSYEVLMSKNVDVVFLDINMPKLKGLDFLRTINDRPEIIITSAYEEYALEGFELQVADYLVKPIRFERFLKAIHVVRDRLSSKKTSSENDHIYVKVDKKQIRIDLSDVAYLESYGNYVKLWMKDSFHLTPGTMTSFEERLSDSFLRIHKSYIVNKKQIKSIEGNSVHMSNGNMISFGKNYRHLLKGILG